ncbi:serine/threonine protein kinase [Pseudanabaena sp. FACHB-1998]|uniref:serine/threonine protein kinase n=1 Tax=Pseudanabaena sp. FACHB-1998 TaxID=2692858 RepID=UPI0016818C9D|nr:serine/threonine-protein kinase [Pseudanabaena sp. FACHB-1998]MBD2177722.1 serine/threonine protein kinase [Pseudanabaena sp. FACHB-1998]
MMSNLLDNRYRVTSILGSGGFGETYLAEDTKMPSNRRCVIKQLKPIADNPQMYELLQQRFQREAAVLETLGEESRYIPKLYANFVENGLFYLVQEWIDGLTLTAEIERNGKWNEALVRALLIKTLQTLIYVHERGIIHRDIKPDNIILRSSEPVLIDFGAVKETLNVSTLRSSAQQAHSIVIGTPGFMASEQAAGRPFFASDLYSLALTAIFALTGKYPQELGTDPQTGEVIWQPHVMAISDDLKAIFTKVLQFDPRDRYSSAREMLTALQPDPQVPNLAETKPIPANSSAANMSSMQTVAVTPRGYVPPSNSTQNQNQSQNPEIYIYQPQKDPKKKVIAQLIATAIVGISLGAAIALGVVITQNGGIAAFWNKLFNSSQPIDKKSFYFLADSAFEDKNYTEKRVQNLIAQGFKQAGLFWIPDYPNLGDSQFYQVYAVPFTEAKSCTEDLKAYVNRVPDAYCAFASKNAKDPVNRITGEKLSVSPPNSPSPTPSPTVTSPKPKPDPEKAIRDYYSLINNRQLQTAWQNLTPKFQRDRASGYQTFTDWWSTVSKVSINSTRIVEIKDNTATIDIDLTYQKGKAIFPETLRMSLVWNEALGQWQINETNRQ